MPLDAGTKIGPYEITGSLGAGGMGEVYRARDARLDRDVAIKVLPEIFAADPDRLARFEREARSLAALNHPNIAHVHGLEDVSGSTARALVMELVEGEDLSERLKRGPLAQDEALAVARQVAEALEAAHERGIVHRDLKPANIKVAADGTVKVLDFGLAKAMDPGTSEVVSATSSPTFTSPMTQMGVILGTAAYMAPEQARGRPVDRRADIWALGAVLFEMLTGKRLYEGETATETIAQIITQPPNFDGLPQDTPAAVRRLLRRCLEKDPRNRIQAAGDVRLELDEIRTSPAAAETSATQSRPSRPNRLPWMTTALFAVIALLAGWKALAPPSAPATSRVRLDVRLGEGEELVVDGNIDGALAILSPDGRTLVYRATVDGQRRLFARALDDLQSRPLAGTDGARSHFFSPDGKWVAFFADRQLMKVNLAGGASVKIAAAVELRGGSWGSNDTIVFAPNIETGLVRVSAAAGEPVPLTTLAEGERTHRWPSILPGGNTAIFVRQDQNAAYDDGIIEAVRIDTGERKVLVRGGTFPRYLPSGHLTYVRQNTVFAVPFDVTRLEVTGDPMPILSGVLASGGMGAGAGDGSAQLSYSDNGTAVYIPGAAAVATNARLAIVDRAGKHLYTAPEAGAVQDPRFSPDASQLAHSVGSAGRRDIFILDIARSATRRLTFDGSVNLLPVWSPDGKRIAYMSDGPSRRGLNVMIVAVDGSSRPEPLTTGDDINLPVSFTSDGRHLVFMQRFGFGRHGQVRVLDVATKAVTVIASGEDDRVVFPRFSPDGRWMVFAGADRDLQAPVLVRPYPGPGGQWQIAEGGNTPIWTRGGREIIFQAGPAGSQIMSVAVDSAGAAIKAGVPTKLFDLVAARPPNAGWFDASPDGNQFAVLLPEGEASARGTTHLTFVFNFLDCSRGPAGCVLRQ